MSNETQAVIIGWIIALPIWIAVFTPTNSKLAYWCRAAFNWLTGPVRRWMA